MTNTETTSNYTFRLQSSIVEGLRQVAEEQGTTLDQYVNSAVAEKLAAMRDLAYLEERAKGADMDAFTNFLENGGGNEPPREGDEIPQGWISRRTLQ
jgi:predicted DNA-binding protein